MQRWDYLQSLFRKVLKDWEPRALEREKTVAKCSLVLST